MVCIIALCVFLCSISCVPTPDEEVVIQKGDKSYEESIFYTTKPNTSPSADIISEPTDSNYYLQDQIIPQHWTDSVETEYLTVPIDAEIVVSSQGSFPVRKVRRGTISTEQVQLIAEAMLPPVTGVWSSTEISHEEYQRALSKAAENGQELSFLQSLNRQIADLDIPSEDYSELNHIQIPEGTFNLSYRCQNGRYATIDKYDNYSVFIRTMQHSNVLPASQLENDGTYMDEGPVHITVQQSQENAKSILNDFLEKSDLMGYHIYYAEKARYYHVTSRDVLSDGWLFSLCRSFEYYPFDTGKYGYCGLFQMETDDFYYAPWEAEILQVFVDEDGVEYLYWSNPIEVVETVNENVLLMDFKELQEEIKRFLQLGLNYLSIDKRHYNPNTSLTKMVLAYVLQPVKDNPDIGYLIPTWVCLFDYRFIGSDKVEFTSMLMFNALNGAPIANIR